MTIMHTLSGFGHSDCDSECGSECDTCSEEGEEEEKKSTKRQGCSCSMKEKRRKQQ